MHTKWEVDSNVVHFRDSSPCAFIKNAAGQIVCDTLNADIVCIGVEHDEDGAIYYDSGGLKYLERIAADHNAMLGIADPAAFMAAVRELASCVIAIERDDGDITQSYEDRSFVAARIVANMLPPETADANHPE